MMEAPDGLYRRTVLVGEDAENGRTRYVYGWGRVTLYPDEWGRIGSTVIEWREPPRGADVYPSDDDFDAPAALGGRPPELTPGPLEIESSR